MGILGSGLDDGEKRCPLFLLDVQGEGIHFFLRLYLRFSKVKFNFRLLLRNQLQLFIGLLAVNKNLLLDHLFECAISFGNVYYAVGLSRHDFVKYATNVSLEARQLLKQRNHKIELVVFLIIIP